MPKSKNVQDEIDLNQFRVAIFGSARTSKEDKLYKQIFNLAKELGKKGIDVVTGGGPGLMEAANYGHAKGDKNNSSESIGLTIQLPREFANEYLELQEHFEKFSGRLDTFMALSNIVVVTPGGIGTCLELFYSWQLVQVKHINSLPIILIGPMWKRLIEWMKKYPLKMNLVSASDFDHIHYAKNNAEALKIISEYHKLFQDTKSDYYKSSTKYKL